MRRQFLRRFFAVLIAVLLITAGLMYQFQGKSTAAAATAICGGIPELGSFSSEGVLALPSIRSLDFDQSGIWFFGGHATAGGGIYAYDPKTEMVERCAFAGTFVASGENVAINEIALDFNGSHFFCTDNDGIWQLQTNTATWYHHGELSGLTEKRCYDFAVDPRDQKLVQASWSGAIKFFGNEWKNLSETTDEYPDIQPPKAPNNFSALLFQSVDMLGFGTMHNGFYLNFQGNWEHFDENGHERWNGERWQKVEGSSLRSFNEIRDLEWLPELGAIVVIAEKDQGGLQLIYTDKVNDAANFSMRMYGFEETGFGHIGSAEVYSNRGLILTSWQPAQYNLVHFLYDATAIKYIATGPAFDTRVQDGNIYIATHKGIQRVQLLQ